MHKRNSICTFPTPIFAKLTNGHQDYVQASYTKFCPN